MAWVRPLEFGTDQKLNISKQVWELVRLLPLQQKDFVDLPMLPTLLLLLLL